MIQSRIPSTSLAIVGVGSESTPCRIKQVIYTGVDIFHKACQYSEEYNTLDRSEFVMRIHEPLHQIYAPRKSSLTSRYKSGVDVKLHNYVLTSCVMNRSHQNDRMLNKGMTPGNNIPILIYLAIAGFRSLGKNISIIEVCDRELEW